MVNFEHPVTELFRYYQAQPQADVIILSFNSTTHPATIKDKFNFCTNQHICQKQSRSFILLKTVLILLMDILKCEFLAQPLTTFKAQKTVQ